MRHTYIQLYVSNIDFAVIFENGHPLFSLFINTLLVLLDFNLHYFLMSIDLRLCSVISLLSSFFARFKTSPMVSVLFIKNPYTTITIWHESPPLGKTSSLAGIITQATD